MSASQSNNNAKKQVLMHLKLARNRPAFLTALMDLSPYLTNLPELKRIPKFQIKGCAVTLWCQFQWTKSAPRLLGYTESKLMAGFLVFLEEAIQAKWEEVEYLSDPVIDWAQWFNDQPIRQIFSNSRQNGLHDLFIRLQDAWVEALNL